MGMESLHGLGFKLNGCPSLPSLRELYEREERQALLDAYRQTGSTRKTAVLLDISQSTVVKKMRKYGIETASLVDSGGRFIKESPPSIRKGAEKGVAAAGSVALPSS